MRQSTIGNSFFFPLSSLFLLTLLAAGCGPSYPACYEVRGKVTFDGQPVTQGTITFYPDEGRSAMGKIQPDGSYTLTTFNAEDGALPGNHSVTIKATSVSGPAAPASFEEELARANVPAPTGERTVTWLVPQRFSQRESSGLSATVQKKSNTIDFDLPNS